MEFYPQFSGLVLPKLVSEGRQFDFAFIDGDHHFDGVFVDLFYVDQLLKPGGVVVFDDISWDGVYLACRFAQTNYGYETIAELAKPAKRFRVGRRRPSADAGLSQAGAVREAR